MLILFGSYGVYAAVLLHKADYAGAFQPGSRREEITSLVHSFVTVLEDAASTESHICHSYSRMLKNMWEKRDGSQEIACRHTERSDLSHLETMPADPRRYLAQLDDRSGAQGSNVFSMSPFYDSPSMENDMSAFSSMGNYLLGSFMPGLADFTTFSFNDNLGHLTI